MMRDYISREAALKAIYTSTAPALEVKAMPAADVVEVVRCRDCVYWRGENDYCKGIGIDFSENGYCAFGERKDGGQEDV